MWRAEVQLQRGGPWLFVAEGCPTSDDAWNATHAIWYRLGYYAARVSNVALEIVGLSWAPRRA